jgi:hypothetical protein
MGQKTPEERKQYYKEYYQKNKDKLRASSREYYQKNKDTDKFKSRRVEYAKNNEDKTRAYQAEYAKDNEDKLRAYRNEYYEQNKDKILEYQAEYRKDNPDKIKERNAKYFKENKDDIRIRSAERRKVYNRNRWKNDPAYRLVQNLRRRVRSALKGIGAKSDTTMNLIGCTGEELKAHIESQFKEGMTWDDYGVHGFHIDHIKPCASFDLTDPEQQKECFHYTNLQPLWAKDNLSKGDKTDHL